MDLGDSGQALFVASDGSILTYTPIGVNAPDNKLALPDPSEPYTQLASDKDYIMVANQSAFTEIYLSVLVPEVRLLQQLPQFQRHINSANF